MGKVIWTPLKDLDPNEVFGPESIGRADRPGQFTYLVDEIPRNLVPLSEARKRKKEKDDR